MHVVGHCCHTTLTLRATGAAGILEQRSVASERAFRTQGAVMLRTASEGNRVKGTRKK